MRKLVSLFTIVTFYHSQRRRPPEDLSSARVGASSDTESQAEFAWVATLSDIFEKRGRFHGLLGLYFCSLLLIAPGSLPLPREERRARPRLFSVSASSLFVFILVLFLLLPLPHLPFLPPPPSSPSSSFFSSFSISSSYPSSFFEYFLAALFISFSFSYSFYFSFSMDLSLWLVVRSRAIFQACLRGLEYLENLGRGLLVEAWSGRPSDANLGREVGKENAETEEANRS